MSVVLVAMVACTGEGAVPTTPEVRASSTSPPRCVVHERTIEEPGVDGAYVAHHRVAVRLEDGTTADLMRANGVEPRDAKPWGIASLPALVLWDWKIVDGRVWLLIEEEEKKRAVRVRVFERGPDGWAETMTSDVLGRNPGVPPIERATLTSVGGDGGIEATIQIEKKTPIRAHLHIDGRKLVSK